MIRIALKNWGTQIASSAHALVDIALPPRCLSCGVEDVSSDQFCMECWGSLQFLTEPLCKSCGTPIDEDEVLLAEDPRALHCSLCQQSPPVLKKTRAAVRYNDVSSALIFKLKYGGKTGMAGHIAHMLMRLLPSADDGRDWLIVPVPLHRSRIWRRGFNQSAMIAQALAHSSKMQLCVDGLVRIKRTRPLEGLGVLARQKELTGAIRPHAKRRKLLQGRSILLVDDVLTSGATSNSCAEALLAAGAERVHLICWARVIPD